MALRKVLSKGMNLGRHVENSFEGINREADERVSENDRLNELGEKFLEDKRKLEEAIERVQRSAISPEDKRKMIDELIRLLEELQEQYEIEVAEEEDKVHEEIQGHLEQIDQNVEELTEQSDSIRGVTMEAAHSDTASAAEAADEKKQQFELLRKEYTEKLQVRMEQAEMQRQEMLKRRLSGR